MKTGTFFEINVSLKGKHVFATDSTIRSYSASEIVELLKLFKDKFPSEDGYEFSVTCWKCSGDVLPDAIVSIIPERNFEVKKHNMSEEAIQKTQMELREND